MNKKLYNHKTNYKEKRPRISLRADALNSDTQLKKIRCLLLALAHKKHGQIEPCGTWEDCFTMEDNTIFFWYQSSKDKSTHLVSQNLRSKYALKPEQVTANDGK